MSGSASYPEAVKFLNALMEWVPDTEYLEIRTSITTTVGMIE